MTEAFMKVVSLSASASWLVLAVIAFRFLLGKAPKFMRVLLWGLVAFRLICPITLESQLSLVPKAPDSGMAKQGFVVLGQVYSEFTADTAAVPDSGTAAQQPSPGVSGEQSGQSGQEPVDAPAAVVDVTAVLAGIWAVGMGVLAVYAAGSYLLLYLRMRTAIRLLDNIYQSEFADSPFVLGFLRPRIYLPFDVSQRDLPYIMAHERAHIARHDHWWKPLGYLLLTVHWFNPVMWAAYILLCRDIELACDEKVIKEMENRQRADYSQSLLTCSIHRRMILACPVAFGEVGVKERVKNVLNYRKPGLWITLLTVLAMVVSLVCFATVQPAQAEEPPVEVTESPAEVTEPQPADWEANRGSSTEMVNSTGIGYTLKATQVTPTGMRLVFVVDQSTVFLRSEYFWIEKQTEGGWTAQERHMEDPVLMANEVYTSGNRIFGGYDWPVDWSGIYGVLEPGTYRLWTTVYAGEEPVSVEFTIGDPGESLKAQALERYYAALDELLNSDSYHLEVGYKDIYDSVAETGVCNDMTRSVYLRSGNDRLYLFVDGADTEASDGSMIRGGMEYRAENEKHFDRRTPMVGWFRNPGMRLSVYTDWVWSYNWTMGDVVSAEMTEDTVTLNLGSDGIATIRFDGDGKLEEIEKVKTSGQGETAHTVTYTLRVMDTSAQEIQAWIDGQNVEFSREFDWAAECFDDAEVADRAFVNTEAVTLNSVTQVIDRARAECTVPYSNVLVHHDAEAGIWKVEFQVGYGKAYTETVYMTDDGVTVKIATFGPLDI